MHLSYLINEYVWRRTLVFFHQFGSIIILTTEIILSDNSYFLTIDCYTIILFL